MTKIYVIKEHVELLSLWRSQGVKGLRILHLDFHDDLRGFVVDRKGRKAYRTGLFRPDRKPPDEGNFLMHAAMEGIVRGIRWVRGRMGGRAYEPGIVKYTEDRAALPHRFAHFLRKDREYPLEFKEVVFEDWKGLGAEEHLDIDWDFFASSYLDPSAIQGRFDEFLRKAGAPIPPAIYLCYSPDHVHPSKEEFLRSVHVLSEKYLCEAVWPKGPFVSRLPDTLPPRKPLTLKKRIILYFRRKGVY